MRMRSLIAICLLLGMVCSVPVPAQSGSGSRNDTRSTLRAANAEMDRLATKLAGDWNSTETMERGSFFPRGGSRTGSVQVTLASGGYTLLYEVHSDGTAGKLDGFHVIWWDQKAQLYRFFSCFNDANEVCVDRGTAHWEGEALVNDYYFDVNGKRTPGRDTFTFTRTTHTLIAAMQPEGSGKMTTLITTRATRR